MMPEKMRMTSHVPVGAAVKNRLIRECLAARRSRVLKYLVMGCALFTASIVGAEPPLDFMKNQIAYLAPELQGDQPQKPVMGCELSDFGSWYDIAYSGGINRFMLGSVRQGVGPNNEFFNTARDVGVLSLFFQTAAGERIYGDQEAVVTWYPYGWRTLTRHGNFEIESATFFTSFNTVAIYAKVTNTGDQPVSITPGLLVTARSGYDGHTNGRVTGSLAKDGHQLWFRNARVGSKTTPGALHRHPGHRFDVGTAAGGICALGSDARRTGGTEIGAGWAVSLHRWMLLPERPCSRPGPCG